MKRLVFILLFLQSQLAFAVTDFTCLTNCTAQGYLYGFCQSRCTVDTTPQPINFETYNTPVRTTTTDFQCLGDCISHGYLYQLCKNKCSY